MRRRFVSTVLVSAAAVAVLAACGTVQAGQNPAGAAPKGPARIGQAPVDAALVTPTFGWVLTADELLLTRDGGAAFTPTAVPVPASWSRAAHFRDPNNGVVVVGGYGAISIATTSDGGQTWRTKRVADNTLPSPVDFGRVQVTFGDRLHGMVMAQWVTGSSFSEATMFVTANGGKTWTARRAPAAGEIVVEAGGRSWLAGGVLRDRLYRSDDQGRRWTKTTLRLAGPAGSMAVSPPRGGVVSVTVLHGGKTQVALLSSRDKGRSWQETGRTTVRGVIGRGVRVPVATTSTGAVVIDTAGGHTYRAGTSPAGIGAAADVAAAGLPEGVYQAGFADSRSGWALSTRGLCADGKQDCALIHTLLGSSDGGASWQTLSWWREALN